MLVDAAIQARPDPASSLPPMVSMTLREKVDELARRLALRDEGRQPPTAEDVILARDVYVEIDRTWSKAKR